MLDGLALLTTDGPAAAAAAMQRAVRVAISIPLEDVLRWGWVATGASNTVWDDEAFSVISARHVQLLRDAGALSQLPLYLSQLGIARAWTGDFGVPPRSSRRARTWRRRPGVAFRLMRRCGSCHCKGGKPKPPQR